MGEKAKRVRREEGLRIEGVRIKHQTNHTNQTN